jgi:hypothetical protein
MEKKKKSDDIKNNIIARNLLYIFSVFMFCFSVYNYLIPHKVMIDSGVEYTRLTGIREIEMDSEVSVMAFIFSFLFWSVIPFYIAKALSNYINKNKK